DWRTLRRRTLARQFRGLSNNATRDSECKSNARAERARARVRVNNGKTGDPAFAAWFAIANRKSTICNSIARVAKLADARDVGSGGAIVRGSSPLPGTLKSNPEDPVAMIDTEDERK